MPRSTLVRVGIAHVRSSIYVAQPTSNSQFSMVPLLTPLHIAMLVVHPSTSTAIAQALVLTSAVVLAYGRQDVFADELTFTLNMIPIAPVQIDINEVTVRTSQGTIKNEFA